MTHLRTLALLALAATLPLASHAAGLVPPPVAAISQGTSAPVDAASGTMATGDSGLLTPDTASIFASGPVPIGDPRWAFRSFTVSAETVQQDEPVQAVEDAKSPTPEPAGLFLLGTGAFATALSIRYRLFAL